MFAQRKNNTKHIKNDARTSLVLCGPYLSWVVEGIEIPNGKDSVPHFTTIAHFVRAYRDEVAKLFEQTVLVCDEHDNLVAYFEGRSSQCRCCSLKHQCMKNPETANHRKGHGRQVSFIQDKRRKPTYTEWMKPRVDRDKDKLICSHRMPVVESLFGNLSSNKRLRQFSLRCKDKVQSQWRLYCMVHNIEKQANYANMAA